MSDAKTEHQTDLLELVQTNTDLTPEEKETGIHFSKADSYCSLYTEIASLVKRAISHTEIDVSELKVKDDEGRVKSIEYSDTLSAEDVDGKIVALKGSFPIGLLKVQGTPRKRNTFAPVISPQEAPDADAFD